MSEPTLVDSRVWDLPHELLGLDSGHDAARIGRDLHARREAVLNHAQAHASQHGTRVPRARFGAHVDVLAGALQSDLPEMFTNYLVWLVTQPAERHRDAPQVRRELADLQRALAEVLPHDHAQVAGALVSVGQSLLDAPGTWTPRAAGRFQVTATTVSPLMEALLAGDIDRARAFLDAAMAATKTPARALRDLITPAFHGIGEAWHDGRITPADEHVATTTAERLLSEARDRLGVGPRRPTSGPPVLLLACPQGNRHATGLHLVALEAEAAGWQVQNLGADVPTDDLVAHVHRHRPALVGLSLSLPRDLVVAQQAIQRLRSARSDVTVLIGGTLFAAHPDAALSLGADHVLGDLDELQDVLAVVAVA